MATDAYRRWVNAGRRYDLATPIKELKALARAHGVGFLGDIGDTAHLTGNNPKDHTPFSFDAWPVALPGYYVCALDLDSDVGFRIVADARRGACPWLKYIQCRGRNFDVRNGYREGTSSDWHTHISVRTDWIFKSIGSYNPFTGTAPEPPPSGGGGGGDLDMNFWDKIGGNNPYSHMTWRELFFQVLGRTQNELPGAIGAVHQQVVAVAAQVQKLQTGGIDVDALATKIAEKIHAGSGATADQIRAIVDDELDEAFRGGADQNT